MQQLEHDMQSVMGAMAREERARIAALALRTASHPEPLLREMLRITAWPGTGAGAFRRFDTQTHDAARAMGAAAARSNGQAVIAVFARVQRGCIRGDQNDCSRSSNHSPGLPLRPWPGSDRDFAGRPGSGRSLASKDAPC